MSNIRIVRFLLFIGITIILLSIIIPTIERHYEAYGSVLPGEYIGYMIKCDSGFGLRIASQYDNETFSVYILTYENGLKALEEGSLENVTIMQTFSNRTILYTSISIPTPGLYAVLVTPSTDIAITVLEVAWRKPYPSQGLMLAGFVFLIIGVVWFLTPSRNRFLNSFIIK